MMIGVQSVGAIEPFDGTWFSNWELENGVRSNREKSFWIGSTEELTQFRKSDVKARNIIVQFLSDNVLEKYSLTLLFYHELIRGFEISL